MLAARFHSIMATDIVKTIKDLNEYIKDQQETLKGHTETLALYESMQNIETEIAASARSCGRRASSCG